MIRHWFYRLALIGQILGLGCVSVGGGVRVTPVPSSVPSVSTTRALAVIVDTSGGNLPLENVHVTLALSDGTIAPCGTCLTNRDGYLVWGTVKIGLRGKITAEREGYLPSEDEFSIDTATPDQHLSLSPVPVPAPWLTVTDDQLYRWRGFISALLGNVPFGPRPNQDTNVIFSAEYTNPGYSAEDRAKMRATAKAKGYTHWPLNPLVSHGYHGRYPDADWRGDVNGYLDRVEELWQDGFIPVFFLLPDTGGDACADGQNIDTSCVERTFTPLFASPRFQALARIVILAWEPEYRATDWQWGVAYMARVFPHAKRGIHFPSGHAAPCRGSDLVEGGGTYASEGACYVPVASALHFVLQQNTFTFTGTDVAPGRTPAQQFLYNLWDMARRLTDGYAGWPTVGADGPVRTIAFEWGSYSVTSDPSLLPLAEQWGSLALYSAPFQDPINDNTVDVVKYHVGAGDSFGSGSSPLPWPLLFLHPGLRPASPIR